MPPATPHPYRKLLRETAKNTDSEALRTALVDFIDKSKESELAVLSDLVARVAKIPPEPPSHCVRCHRSYTSKKNDNQACVVPHVFDVNSQHISGYSGYNKEYSYKAACCTYGNTSGYVPVLIEEGSGNDDFKLERMRPRYCYVDQHTTDAYAVEYKPYSVINCKEDANGKCTRIARRSRNDPLFTDAVESGESDSDMEDSDEESISTDGSRMEEP